MKHLLLASLFAIMAAPHFANADTESFCRDNDKAIQSTENEIRKLEALIEKHGYVSELADFGLKINNEALISFRQMATQCPGWLAAERARDNQPTNTAGTGSDSGKRGVFVVGEGRKGGEFPRKFWLIASVGDEATLTRELLEQCRRTPFSENGTDNCRVEDVWSKGCMYFAQAPTNIAWGAGPTREGADRECSRHYGEPCKQLRTVCVE